MKDEELLSKLSDPTYIDKIINAKTCEELYNVLKSEDINISHEDVEDVFNQINKYKDSNLKQLSDDQLSDLSGGGDWSKYRKVITTVPYYTGYIIGRLPVIGVAICSAIKGAKEQISEM